MKNTDGTSKEQNSQLLDVQGNTFNKQRSLQRKSNSQTETNVHLPQPELKESTFKPLRGNILGSPIQQTSDQGYYEEEKSPQLHYLVTGSNIEPVSSIHKKQRVHINESFNDFSQTQSDNLRETSGVAASNFNSSGGQLRNTGVPNAGQNPGKEKVNFDAISQNNTSSYSLTAGNRSDQKQAAPKTKNSGLRPEDVQQEGGPHGNYYNTQSQLRDPHTNNNLSLYRDTREKYIGNRSNSTRRMVIGRLHESDAEHLRKLRERTQRQNSVDHGLGGFIPDHTSQASGSIVANQNSQMGADNLSIGHMKTNVNYKRVSKMNNRSELFVDSMSHKSTTMKYGPGPSKQRPSQNDLGIGNETSKYSNFDLGSQQGKYLESTQGEWGRKRDAKKEKLTLEEQRELQNLITKKPVVSAEQMRKNNIKKLDIQDVNRNTRFFKDYLKDQYKENKKNKKDQQGLVRMLSQGPQKKVAGAPPGQGANGTMVTKIVTTNLDSFETEKDEEDMEDISLSQIENSDRHHDQENTLQLPKSEKQRTLSQESQKIKKNQQVLKQNSNSNQAYSHTTKAAMHQNLDHMNTINSQQSQQLSEDISHDSNLTVDDNTPSALAIHMRQVKQMQLLETQNEGNHDSTTPKEGGTAPLRRMTLHHEINGSIIGGQQHSRDGEEDEDNYEDQIKRINSYKHNRLLINPESHLRTFIDTTSFFLLLIISLYIPFVICFDYETGNRFMYFELFLDIFFLSEIVSNFFTGYYEKGLLVMDLNLICRQYMRTYFTIDLLGSIPISFISVADSFRQSVSPSTLQSAKFVRIIRMTRYLRLLRLIRFIKVSKIMQSFEVFIVSEYAHLMMKFFNICMIVIFVAHWIACLMYSVTQYEGKDGYKSWLHLGNIQDAGVVELYVNSLYWVITTTCTVGYGDYHPVTTNERIVSTITMITQSGLFAYIIGDIGRMVTNFNLLASHFRERMNYVEKFLREKDIPISLRQQVKRYLEYNWELKKLYKIEETELLTLLNDNLRGKLIVYFNGKILQSIDVFGNFPIEFLSNLCFILQQRVYAIDDTCVTEGEFGSEIFYISTGRVSVIDKKTKTHITDLVQDQYFGEIAFFSNIERQSTIKARDFSEMLVLKREDFLSMASKVSLDALGLFHQISEQIDPIRREFDVLFIKCYHCKKLGHIARDCESFRQIKGNLKQYYKDLYNVSLESEESHYGAPREEKQILHVSFAGSLDHNVPEDIDEYYRTKYINSPQIRMTTEDLSPVESITPQKRGGVTFENRMMRAYQFPKKLQCNNLDDEENKSEVEALEEYSKQESNITDADQAPAFLDVGMVFQGRERDFSFYSKQTSNVKSSKSSSTLVTPYLPQPTSHFLSPISSPMLPQFAQPQSVPKPPVLNIEQVIHPKIVMESPHQSASPDSSTHKLHSQNTKTLMAHVENVVIVEDENENAEDEFMMSETLRSGDELSRADIKSNNVQSTIMTPTSRPKLVLRHTMVPRGPPKSQNELTKIIGKLKRFGSKNFRENKKGQQDPCDQQLLKRQITIQPVHKQVTTVVKKTYTTFVETQTHQRIEYDHRPQKQKVVSSRTKTSHHSTSVPAEKTKKQQSFYSKFIQEGAQKNSGEEIFSDKNKTLSSSSSQSTSKRARFQQQSLPTLGKGLAAASDKAFISMLDEGRKYADDGYEEASEDEVKKPKKSAKTASEKGWRKKGVETIKKEVEAKEVENTNVFIVQEKTEIQPFLIVTDKVQIHGTSNVVRETKTVEETKKHSSS